MSDTANFYEYLCRTCGHHERKHAGYPLACVACDSHNLLRTPLFREPKPGEYDFWARDQHIEVLKAEVERLRAENAALTAEREAVEKLLLDNGYGGAGFASLADAIDATLGELRRLERIAGEYEPLVERLRAALDDLGAFEWRYVVPPDSDGTNDALCLRCQGRGRTIRAIIHRDTCPYVALNEEPADDE